MATVNGTSGDNALTGTSNADTINGLAGNDTITAGAGNDILKGGEDNDVYRVGAGGGYDTYSDIGKAGTDRILAIADNFFIGLKSGFGPASGIEEISANGHVGVTIRSEATNDKLDFSTVQLTGIASINGGAGNDSIIGSAGADTIVGSTGNDTLDGGGGSDTYLVGLSHGVDSIADTGSAADTDRIVASASNVAIGLKSGFGATNGIEQISSNGYTGVTILGAATDDSLNFSTVQLVGISSINGGAGNDSIKGSATADTLVGGAGNDTLDGGGGNDTYLVGVGHGVDSIADTGSAADTDRILASAANVAIGLKSGFGAANGIEQISSNGYAGVTIQGGANADVLDFSTTKLVGITAINGGAGADFIVGSAGNDVLRGQEDGDIYLITKNAGFDSIVDTGLLGTDSIRAAADNVAIGLKGNFGAANGIEEIRADGHSGVTIQGDSDANTLDFSTTSLLGISAITGGAGNDTIIGSAAEDTIIGAAGNDTLKGGDGVDTYLIGKSEGFDSITDTGLQNGDRILATADNMVIGLRAISGIELISANAHVGVTISGDTGNNILDFSATTLTGISSINGGAGNDTLTGGAGNDRLIGGAGADRFVLAADYTGATPQNRDLITDFVTGTDKLDLTKLDADTTAAGQSAFRFLGTKAFDGAAGALHTVYDSVRNVTTLEADTNGDKVADIKLELGGKITLATGDFAAGSLAGAAVVINGDDNDNTLNGTGNKEILNGLGGNDTLNGNGSDDVLDGGAGNDTLDGGTGNDTAVFHGKVADYQITYSFGGAYVSDLNVADGDDGIDGVFNIEHAKFADDTIDIRPEPIVNGVAAGDDAGTSVAGIGDINKDGFADFVVGAPGVNSNTGAAYVVFGSAAGLSPSLDLSSLDGTNGFKLSGIAAGDRNGFSVAGAGDINKDGYADFIIGALDADAPSVDTGATYVVFGHGGAFGANFDLSTLNGSNGFQVNGWSAGDLFGGSVAAGDFNGDGYSDLIVGADASGTKDVGSADIIYGQSGTFQTNHPPYFSSYLELVGVQSYDHAGWSVSSAGDFNGDGIDDVLVGSILAGTSGGYTGAAYVVFGHAGSYGVLSLASINGTNGVKLAGVAQYESAGFSVSSAGDFNGDGFDDVIVSAPYADANGTDSGNVYVVFGHGGAFAANIALGQLNGSDGFKIQGLAAGDYAGWSVSSAGDVNGDGLEDLIIGAPNAASNYGAAYVLFGQGGPMDATVDLSKLDARHGFRVEGDYAGDFAGVSVSAAGDINGDGFDDLLVGAPGADPNGDSSGAVEIIYGGRSDSHAIGGTDKADTLTGTSVDDVLRGLAGADTLNSLGGNDLLDGGKDADKLIGGAGNDTYVLDNAGDTVTEAAAGGIDTLKVTGIDIDLTKGSFSGQEIENITLLGTGNNSVTGNALDNAIQGNDGDNLLSGGAGNDTMTGGKGNDTYVVDASGDKVVEGVNGGVDTVRSAISYTLADNFENLVLTGALGTENLTGIGNGSDNTITGNGGNNLLSGGVGNDALTGGKGVDTLTGGTDADMFVFATGDSGAQSGARDLVTDFQSGTDHIDLHGLDTNPSAGGVQIARFIGSQTFQDAGDLRYSYDAAHNVTVLEADFNGDKVADFGIELTGKLTLTAQDFAAGSVLSPNLVRPASVTIVNDDDLSIDYSGIRPTVSAAGDLNHDGYADIVIGLGASGNPNGVQSGNAYVIYGTRAGIPDGISLADIDGTNGFKISGTTKNETLGYGADTAGDFNGDGVSDLLLSAPFYSGDAGSNPERAYLIYGDATDGFASPLDLSQFTASDGLRFQGTPQFSGGVGSVASLGDINADGFDDIAIGFGNDADRGVAYVVFGGNGAIPTDLTALNGTTGFKIPGQQAFGGLGQSVSGAGDVNGDGIKDLVVSDLDSVTGNHTTPHVIFGHAGAFPASIQASGLNGSAGFSIVGAASGQGFAFNQTVSSAGDMNGDGYGDLIIGSNGSPAYVVFGHGGAFGATIDISSLNGTNGFAITAPFSQYLGRSVSSVGDLNGDGYADILIGAPNEPNASDPGHAYVLYGHAGGFAATIDVSQITGSAGFVISGHALNDQAGWSVSGAGDIDGDGLDDLLVASPQAAGSNGEVQVIYGKASASAIMGTDNADTLNGTAAANILIGGHSRDTINGNGGADSIHGGSGDDHIHVSNNAFFRIDGGSGTDVLHLDFAGAIDFGNLDGNAATSDRGKISGIETIDVDNGQNNAMTLHLADVLDLDVQNTDVGGKAALDNVLTIEGNAGDTLHLLASEGWGAANTSALAGYAIYNIQHVQVAVDTQIAVTVN